MVNWPIYTEEEARSFGTRLCPCGQPVHCADGSPDLCYHCIKEDREDERHARVDQRQDNEHDGFYED